MNHEWMLAGNGRVGSKLAQSSFALAPSSSKGHCAMHERFFGDLGSACRRV